MHPEKINLEVHFPANVYVFKGKPKKNGAEIKSFSILIKKNGRFLTRSMISNFINNIRRSYKLRGIGWIFPFISAKNQRLEVSFDIYEGSNLSDAEIILKEVSDYIE